jgi:hypothetical protein
VVAHSVRYQLPALTRAYAGELARPGTRP